MTYLKQLFWKKFSKAEKLRLHCCGTDKIIFLKLLSFHFLTSSLCYLYPYALNSPWRLMWNLCCTPYELFLQLQLKIKDSQTDFAPLAPVAVKNFKTLLLCSFTLIGSIHNKKTQLVQTCCQNLMLKKKLRHGRRTCDISAIPLMFIL